MTFAAPGWLALLLAIPLLWWLHRRLRAPREIVVSSVLLFRGEDGAAPAARPQRRLDPVLLAVACAVALLAVAASGPVFGVAPAPTFYVVLDTSASMGAARAPGGARALDRAATRAADLLADAVPGCRLEVRAIGDDVSTGMAPVELPGHAETRSVGGADGLPLTLAAHLDSARARGFPGVVVVTDRGLDLADVAVIGPEEAPGPNAALADVVLDGDALVVSVRNHGGETRRIGLRGRIGLGDHASAAAVPAGGFHEFRVPAPTAGSGFSFELLHDGDALPADDHVRGRRVDRAPRVHVEDAGLARLIRPVLDAAGFRVVDADAATHRVRRGGVVRAQGGVLHFAPESTEDAAPFSLSAGPSSLLGRDVFAQGDAAPMLPEPATALVAAGRVAGGTVVLADASGGLVASADGVVVCALDPLDAASTWERDASFPVLTVWALAGDEPELELDADGPARVPQSESELPERAPEPPSTDALRAVARTPNAAVGTSGAGAALALGAALLLGSTAVFVGRRRSRAAP